MSIRSFAELCIDVLQPLTPTSLSWDIGVDELYDNKFSYQSIHDQPAESEKLLAEHLVTIFQKAQ